jgi:phosphatidylserine decarboxylase
MKCHRFLQSILPHHPISRVAGYFANARTPWLKNFLIRQFLKFYPVNMKEAVQQDPFAFSSFNDFFTRALDLSKRPIDQSPGVVISPADGAISEAGKINGDKLLQAKGWEYSLSALLGGEVYAKDFENGHFCTIYLAPVDYHRVHMPYEGKLLGMQYVPGKLFSVSTKTANTIPNLFAKNERVITYFMTDKGPMAVILVGAMIVGSIHLSFAGKIAPGAEQEMFYQDFKEKNITLKRGDELGHFMLGSTVIVLHSSNDLQYSASCKAGEGIRMGQRIAAF